MYRIDQHKECFKSKEEATEYLRAKIEKENEQLKRQLDEIKERLTSNYKYLGKELDFDDDIFIVMRKFLDGQIEDVIGYTNDENIAKRSVKNLHDTTGEGEFSFL